MHEPPASDPPPPGATGRDAATPAGPRVASRRARWAAVALVALAGAVALALASGTLRSDVSGRAVVKGGKGGATVVQVALPAAARDLLRPGDPVSVDLGDRRGELAVQAIGPPVPEGGVLDPWLRDGVRGPAVLVEVRAGMGRPGLGPGAGIEGTATVHLPRDRRAEPPAAASTATPGDAE